MKIYGSSTAGRTVGMLFLSIGAAMFWAAMIGGLASHLLELSQRATQVVAAIIFLLVIVCLVPAIRRVASGGEP